MTKPAEDRVAGEFNPAGRLKALAIHCVMVGMRTRSIETNWG